MKRLFVVNIGRGIGSQPGASGSSCYDGCYNAVMNAGT